jgi:outer membrane murein-binding lipoprotein Lpp
MRLALAPKVAVVAGDTAVAEEDRVVADVDKAETEVDKVAAEVDKAETEVDKVDTVVVAVDEGAADEGQRQTETSNHRHSTYITLVVKISPNSSPFREKFRHALMGFLDKPNGIF